MWFFVIKNWTVETSLLAANEWHVVVLAKPLSSSTLLCSNRVSQRNYTELKPRIVGTLICEFFYFSGGPYLGVAPIVCIYQYWKAVWTSVLLYRQIKFQKNWGDCALGPNLELSGHCLSYHGLTDIILGYYNVVSQCLQEAQLSQRDRPLLRVIEYFAQSLEFIRNLWVE